MTQDEEEKRTQLSNKFNDSVKDISVKLEEYNSQREQQTEHITLLQNQLNIYQEQYEKREKQVEKIIKAKELETKISEVKLKEALENSLKDQVKIKAYQDTIEKLVKEEVELKLSNSQYQDSYTKLQEMIGKYTEILSGFKVDMEKMVKVNTTLSQDNKNLKTKSEKSDRALVELFNEKTNLLTKLESQTKQIETLKGLCQTLTNDRKELQQKLSNTTTTTSDDNEKNNNNNKEDVSKQSSTLLEID